MDTHGGYRAGGGDRRAGRAALVRFWKRQHLLGVPFPLIRAAALRADARWEADAWIPVFLDAIAGEAEDCSAADDPGAGLGHRPPRRRRPA